MTVAMPYFWTNKEWYTVDKENGGWVLTDKAPQEAVKSYEEFMEMMKEHKEMGLTSS